MDKDKLDYFKEKLLQEKEVQMNSLKNREQEKDQTIELLDSELSSYDNHPADVGTEVYMMEQEQGFKDQIKSVIREIDDSLEDIKEGRYGYCSNCNKNIQEERLELIPYAKTCLECTEENKDDFKDPRENDKKIYESLNYETFNLSPGEKEDSTGYDGKDTLKDLFEDNIVDDDPSLSTGDNMGLIEEGQYNDSEMVEEIEKISEEEYKDTL
nr:TraR/DksA C4-type zinc finger protein [Tissierella sp.]